MILGKVIATRRENDVVWLEPRIGISVAGINRVFREEEAMVDTGFTGWLALPDDSIARLGLTHYGQRPAHQAAGESRMFDVYSALVLWHGRPYPVVVHGTRGVPLVGMALLNGNRLTVDSWEGGDVIIEESP